MARVLGVAALIVVGAGLVAAGVSFGATRLVDADKWGSVVGALVALIGLPMTAAGLYLTWRSSKQTPAVGQSVTGSGVGGDVNQISGVTGSVRFGAAPVLARAPVPSISPSPAADQARQQVRDSQVTGHLRQIDNVGGDVEIDK